MLHTEDILAYKEYTVMLYGFSVEFKIKLRSLSPAPKIYITF